MRVKTQQTTNKTTWLKTQSIDHKLSQKDGDKQKGSNTIAVSKEKKCF